MLAFDDRAPGLTDEERENVRLVNRYRLGYDLLPLRVDVDLVKSARTHSRFQQAVGDIAHEFPGRIEPAGRTPRARIVRAGDPARYAGGENVLCRTRDPRAAFDGWRRSPGHRANLLAPYWTEIGVGEHLGSWTQNFGREPDPLDHAGK